MILITQMLYTVFTILWYVGVAEVVMKKQDPSRYMEENSEYLIQPESATKGAEWS